MRHADRDRSGGQRAAALPSTVRAVAAVAVALVAVAATAVLPGGQALVVTDADSGEVLLAAPVEDGATVTLAYTHSVEQTPVRDVYVVRDRRLVMTAMRFRSYGWGLPARADVTLEDGWFVAHPDWEGRELYVTPGRIADHRLVVDGRSHDLVALSGAQTVRVSVTRRSLLERLLGVRQPIQSAGDAGTAGAATRAPWTAPTFAAWRHHAT